MLDEHDGYGPGFDFLRLFLAVCVVLGHTSDIMGERNVATSFMSYVVYSVLSMFFSLGGFLVASSALRLKLGDFLINRSLRVIPALAVEVVLSVLILGPLLTTVPLAEYFADSRPYRYILNIVGWVSYDLPGVFKTHPSSNVNESLWTMPFEYGFYGLLAVFMCLGVLKRPLVVVWAAVLSIGIGVATVAVQAVTHIDIVQEYGWVGQIDTTVFCGPGSRLLVGFLIGTAFYLYRYALPYSKSLFAICLGYVLALSQIDIFWWMEHLPVGPATPVLNLLCALPVTYVMIFIGVSDVKLPKLLRGGDYSYGVYLYSFPIQQALYAAYPVHDYFVLRLLVQTIVILPIAMLSWHYIEKPVLKMRQKFSFIARRRLNQSED